MSFSPRQWGLVLLLVGILAGWAWGIAWILNAHGARVFVLFVLVGIGSYLVHYWNGARWMKRQFGARPANLRVVDRLAKQAGLSRVPNVYVTRPMQGANAFTVSYADEDAIFVTPEIARARRELQAPILAHEVARIHHRDSQVLGFVSAFEQVIGNLGNLWVMLFFFGPLGWLLLLMVWPFLLLIQAWSVLTLAVYQPLARRLMRGREYLADRRAAEWTSPRHMAAALQKLEQYNRRGLAGLFQTDEHSPLSTHPPLEDRLANLRSATT